MRLQANYSVEARVAKLLAEGVRIGVGRLHLSRIAIPEAWSMSEGRFSRVECRLRFRDCRLNFNNRYIDSRP